jgi:adenine phosphoribosyltransferase
MSSHNNKDLAKYENVKAFSKKLMDVIFDAKHRSIIKDFPTKGINFIDVNELFVYPELYAGIGENLSLILDTLPKADLIIATEARGFLIGSILAVIQKLPFVPVRKKGKLPEGKTIDGQDIVNHTFSSATEYSVQDLCISGKAIDLMKKIMIDKNKGIKLDSGEYAYMSPVERSKVKPVNVILNDDLLATGKTFKSINDFILGLDKVGIKANIIAALSIVDLNLKPNFITSYNFETNQFDNYSDDKIKSYSLVTIPKDIESTFKAVNGL